MNTAKAEAEMAYGLQASKVQARIKEEEMQVLTKAGNLCTREYSVLRFFGFGAGFISDQICSEGEQCIQFIGGLKLKPCYK